MTRTTKQTLNWHLITNPTDSSQLPAIGSVVISLRKSGLMSIDIYNGSFEPLVNWRSRASNEQCVAWANIKLTDDLYDHLVNTVGLNAKGEVKRASKYLTYIKP